MRLLIQRVSRASVHVDGKLCGSIGRGILVLIGIGKGDSPKDADYLADKLVNLRIFPDDQGRMNRSARDVDAAISFVNARPKPLANFTNTF